MSTDTGIDMEKFRLRPLVERLIEMGEVEVHDEPVALSDLSTIIENSSKAVLFRKAGPEQVEMVGSVAGSRSRVAAAFGVAPDELVGELQSRLGNPQPIQEVTRDEAPVQQVVLEGDEADLSKLPFHPQHQFDGGTYISSAIDFSVDPQTGRTNVGCRRLSLRGRHEAMTNVTAPSDLREIYKGCVERGEPLTVNFTVGSHTLDFMAACMKMPTDEDTLLGTLRGEPVPMVKAVSNDLRVPADAEIIIEGY
ncbi:MAG: UbiD family decarboxylase, partial [Rhodospirillales bacterium]|nr:UbiD family decarboxylase [Rhodospirillales bacterium]